MAELQELHNYRLKPEEVDGKVSFVIILQMCNCG